MNRKKYLCIRSEYIVDLGTPPVVVLVRVSSVLERIHRAQQGHPRDVQEVPLEFISEMFSE